MSSLVKMNFDFKYDFDEVVPRWEHNSMKWTDWSCYGIDETRRDILPMWIADMDFKCEPRILNEIRKIIEWGVIGYDSPKEAFYDVFINWQRRRNAWEVYREQIVPVPGVVFGIVNAMQVFTKEHDKILIQTPVYYPFYTIIEKNNRELVKNPLIDTGHRYEIDLDDLDKKLEGCKMMILCSPHNPVGRVWTSEELQKVGELCLKHGVLLVSDEIHSDLILSGYKHTPIAKISEEIAENTITLTAPSKTFNIAGLNQSVAIISNKKLRDKYKDNLIGSGLAHLASFSIVGFEAAYKYGEEWLDEALAYIEKNVDYALEYIEKNIPGVVTYKPEGTFLMWLNLQGYGIECEKLNEIFINEGKILLDYGCKFGDESAGYYRLNVAVPRKTLVEALERIKKACDSL